MLASAACEREASLGRGLNWPDGPAPCDPRAAEICNGRDDNCDGVVDDVLDPVHDVRPSGLAAAIDMLLNHKDLTLQDAEVVAAALQQFQSRPSLRFSDCLVLEVARKAGHLPLGTFDRNLSKLDGAEKL